jgi:hypothetical protein
MLQNGMLIFSTEFKKTVVLRLKAGGWICELGRYGDSRDHFPYRLQIVYGLLCEIAVKMFGRRRADNLASQVRKVKAAGPLFFTADRRSLLRYGAINVGTRLFRMSKNINSLQYGRALGIGG